MTGMDDIIKRFEDEKIEIVEVAQSLICDEVLVTILRKDQLTKATELGRGITSNVKVTVFE